MKVWFFRELFPKDSLRVDPQTASVSSDRKGTRGVLVHHTDPVVPWSTGTCTTSQTITRRDKHLPVRSDTHTELGAYEVRTRTLVPITVER